MNDQRKRTLQSYGQGPLLLTSFLCNIPRRMWAYKPSPETWSVQETILHLADHEAIEYVSCRGRIADPDALTPAINLDCWVARLGYFHQNTTEALGLIRRLRMGTHRLLMNLPESVWARRTEGPRHKPQSLADWLVQEERYIPGRIRGLQENYLTWTARRARRNIKPSLPHQQPVESTMA
jgi:hypothetical protein